MTETRDGRDGVDVPTVLVDDVREMLSDDALSNELIEGREFSDEALAKCLVYIVRDFNVAPPVLSYKLTFPVLFSDQADLRPGVVDAAVGRATWLGGMRRLRNQMPYQAGSISYDPNAVAAALMQTGEKMLARWAQQRDSYKLKLNIDGGFYVANSDLATREIFNGATITVYGGQVV